MATMSLPSFSEGRISNSELSVAKSEMIAGEERFANEIEQAVEFTGVPKEIILPFMYLESKCKNVRNVNTSATGPMQLMPNSVADIICINKNRVKANPQLQAKLVQLFGAKRVNGCLIKGMDGSTAMNRYGKFTRPDLDNAEGNILLGAMYLDWLIDGNTNAAGKIDIERVIVKYNRGMNTKVIGSTPLAVLTYVRVRYGTSFSDYILKMTGKNGFLTAYA